MLSMGAIVKFAPASVLLPVLPPPDILAVRKAFAGAVADTLKVTLMSGKALLTANASGRVQVRVANAQLHPGPVIAVTTRPGDNVVATEIVPAEETVP